MNAVVDTGRPSSPRFVVHWFDGVVWSCTPFALPEGAALFYAESLRHAKATCLERVA